MAAPTLASSTNYGYRIFSCFVLLLLISVTRATAQSAEQNMQCT